MLYAKFGGGREELPYISEDRSRSLLRDAGAYTLGALGYAGESLDKPGRALRQLLAEGRSWFGGPEHDFKPSELLAWVPFSDTVGLTDVDDAAYGKDVTGWDDPDSKWDGITNFAVEVVADPLNLVTLGGHQALSKGGKALSKMGILDDAIEETARLAGRELSATGKWGDQLGGFMKRKTKLENSVGDVFENYKAKVAFDSVDEAAAAKKIKSLDDRFAHLLKDEADVDGNIAYLLDEKVGGLIGKHSLNPIPFTGRPSMWGDSVGIAGTGKLSQDIASAGAIASDAFKRLPPVNFARRHLSAPLGKAIRPFGQAISKAMHRGKKDAQSRVMLELADITRQADETQFAGRSPEHRRMMLDYLTGQHDRLGKYHKKMQYEFRKAKMPSLLGRLRKLYDDVPELTKKYGIETELLDDIHNRYVYSPLDPRFMKSSLAPEADPISMIVDTQHLGMEEARQELFRDLPGGHSEFMKASLDPNISGYLHRPGKTGGRLTDESRELLTRYVEKEYPGLIKNTYRSVQPDGTLGKAVRFDPSNADHLAARESHLNEVVDFLADLDPRYEQSKTHVFKDDPFKQAQDYLTSVHKAIEGASVTYDALGSIANTRRALLDAGFKDTTPLTQVLKDLKLVERESGMPTAGSIENILQGMLSSKRYPGRAGVEEDHVTRLLGIKNADDLFDALTTPAAIDQEISIPRVIHEDMVRAYRAMFSPQGAGELRALTRLWDGMLNAWKVGVTQKFIPFHIRNRSGGAFNNHVIGAGGSTKDALDLGRGNIIENASDIFFDVNDVPPEMQRFIRNGKVVIPPGADPMGVVSGTNSAAEANDALATQLISYLVDAHKVWSDQVSWAGAAGGFKEGKRRLDLIQGRGKDAFGEDKVAPTRVGWIQSVGDGLKRMAADEDVPNLMSWGTLADVVTGGASGNIAGKGAFGGLAGIGSTRGAIKRGSKSWGDLLDAPDRDSSWFNAIGNKTGNEIEFRNRVAPFIDLLKQGYSPKEAARKVAFAQVDHSMLSEMEQTIFKRLIPFYSFTRGMAPFVLENLANKPSGLMGQTMRGVHRIRRDDEDLDFAPEYIRRGTGFTFDTPFSEQEHNRRNFITSLGLPWEDLVNTFEGSPTDMVINRLPPFVKSPLESTFGRSLFYDKPLWAYPSKPSGEWYKMVAGFLPMSGATAAIIPGWGRQGPVAGAIDIALDEDGDVREDSSWVDPQSYLNKGTWQNLLLKTGSPIGTRSFDKWHKQKNWAVKDMIEEIAKEKQFDGSPAYSTMESIFPTQEYKQFLQDGGDMRGLWFEYLRKHNEKQRRRFQAMD